MPAGRLQPRHPWLTGLTLLSLPAGCRKSNPINPSPAHATSSPKQTPVHLEVSTIEKFVDWVSSMPVSQVPDVKKQIALVASDTTLVDAIAGKLSFQTPVSYGRQLIYLSILGEMKNEHALPALSSFVNSKDCLVFEERGLLKADSSQGTTYFDYCAGLKSAAINMISYINSQSARQIVLRAIHDHPSRAVRVSGMNSFLYNQNDSTAAVELVRRHARANEAKLVGIPRLEPQSNLKEFGDRLARYYAEHPEDAPQLPTREEGNPAKGNIQPHVRSSAAPSKGPS